MVRLRKEGKTHEAKMILNNIKKEIEKMIKSKISNQ
jgi:hypothetical protein